MPTLKDHVVLYEGAEPVFDAYNLEGDISRALKRKVWLKSGGYITIEHTEALVAVDVNGFSPGNRCQAASVGVDIKAGKQHMSYRHRIDNRVQPVEQQHFTVWRFTGNADSLTG